LWGVVWQTGASIAGAGSLVTVNADPSVYLTAHVNDPTVFESYVSNVNDKIELDVEPLTLVGRTDPERGPAQGIEVPENTKDTLRLRNKQLFLDLSAGTRLDFDNYVATTNARLAALEATVYLPSPLTAALASLTARVSAIEAAGTFLGLVNYTVSGPIVIPPNARRCKIKMWGGSCGSTAPYAFYGQGGGPPGPTASYLEKFLTGLVPGQTLSFQFPIAGLGGSHIGDGQSGQTGLDGGDAILSSGTQIIPTLIAGGSKSAGPTVGVASGGDVNVNGQLVGTTSVPDGSGGSTISVNQPLPVTVFSRGSPGYGADGPAGACFIEWYSGAANTADVPIFAGVGGFRVNAVVQRLHQQSITYAILTQGSGVVNANATRMPAPGSTLLGTGSLTSDATRIVNPGTSISGAGSFTGDATTFTPAH